MPEPTYPQTCRDCGRPSLLLLCPACFRRWRAAKEHVAAVKREEAQR